MNLGVNDVLELNPRSISGRTFVTVRYSVGANTLTKARDRIVVGGIELADQESFPVTGTKAFPQKEVRHIEVDPASGIAIIQVDVFVIEVDSDNRPTGDPEQQASARLDVEQ